MAVVSQWRRFILGAPGFALLDISDTQNVFRKLPNLAGRFSGVPMIICTYKLSQRLFVSFRIRWFHLLVDFSYNPVEFD
jgi:hypothetical protein